jgi:hypothetical protein
MCGREDIFVGVEWVIALQVAIGFIIVIEKGLIRWGMEKELGV